MPSLILDKKEKMISRFISSNGLVEDPCAVEKERSVGNPWMPDETEIFIDKLTTFGKDFRKISSFLDHKTTADCVEFYYKNHKSDCFKKAKKKPEFAKHEKSHSSNTYLVTSVKRWNREVNVASLDMLGAASAIAANVEDGIDIQQKCISRYFIGPSRSDYKAPRSKGSILDRSSSLDIFGNERETVAADVLAGICGSFSSEAMSSCITSSVDPGECYQEWKCRKVRRRSLTPEVIQNFDDETCSDESYGEMDSTDWTDAEKSIFIQAVTSYGKDFSMISRCVRTRSRDQCKIFFSKARKCLGLENICPGPGVQGTPVSDEANGGGSDGEDACVVESGSVVCYEKSGSKMEEDLLFSDSKINHGVAEYAGPINLQPVLNQSEDNNRSRKVESKGAVISSGCWVPDLHEMDIKVEPNVEGDSYIETVVSCESVAVQGHQVSAVMPSNSDTGRDEVIGQGALEKSVSVEAPGDHSLLSESGAAVETKAVREVPTEHSTGGQKLLLPERSLNERQNGYSDANIRALGGLNCAIQDSCCMPSSAAESSHLVADTHSSELGVIIGYQHKTDLDFDSAQKPHVISLQQENLGTVNSGPPDSSQMENEKTLNNDLTSTLNLKKSGDQNQKSAKMDDCHNCLSSSLLGHVESSPILTGYPLSVSTKKERHLDVSYKKPVSLHGISKADRNFPSSQALEQNHYLQPCNGSKGRGSVGGLPLLSKEQKRDIPMPPSQVSPDMEKPCRNGDVKLFGQILTHASSQQKSNSSTRDNEDKSSPRNRSSVKSFNLKFSGNHSADGNSPLFDCNDYLAIENLPVRSYGFWDGKRVQKGFPSLPDSAILLAKYPAAFGNYPSSSPKIEHQPLLNVVKSNECTLNGEAVFPTREISSSNGVADYQVYRSRDGAAAQPFRVDMKQRQDLLLSDMQRRNGFEAVSSVQQQARGVVGINVPGKGGMLLGGSCTGVSDPVAAIKMHYAKAEQYSTQAGSIIRDEDSWRGKGDIGR